MLLLSCILFALCNIIFENGTQRETVQQKVVVYIFEKQCCAPFGRLPCDFSERLTLQPSAQKSYSGKWTVTCNKYASLEMYIWSEVLLHLCSSIHNQPFTLAHEDNNCFHAMVSRGTVAITFPKQFLIGTNRTLFRCIALGQLPSTKPSPTHLATSDTTSQAPVCTPAHQNFEALSHMPPPNRFCKHRSQPPLLPTTPKDKSFQAVSPTAPTPTTFSKHQS